MSKMHKRLAKSIRKFGQYDDDAESLAAYLIARGWRDTEKRPRVQQVTVIPNPSMPELIARLNDNLDKQLKNKRSQQ